MKFGRKTKIVWATLICLSLSSCWFNTAGQITSEAKHRARVNTADAKWGDYVRTNGSKYYVRMTHIFDDESPNFILWANNEGDNSEHKVWNEGPQWYSVNPSFARYITGNGGYSNLTSIVPVTDGEAESATTKQLIINPHQQIFYYTHRSPYAPWLYACATFNWICIDLPVSIAGCLAFGFLCASANAKAESAKGTYSYSGSSSPADDSEARIRKEARDAEFMNMVQDSLRNNP